MKIALLIDTLRTGGAELVAALSAAALARKGHDVSMVSYHAENDYAPMLHEAGVIMYDVHQPGRVKRLQDLRAVWRTGRFDVVHALKAPALLSGMLAAAGMGPWKWLGGHHALTSESLMVRTLCRLAAGQVRGWIVPSHAAAEVVQRDYGVSAAEVWVVPNPVDLRRFHRTRVTAEAKDRLGITVHRPVVTMVANLHPWKNYPLFVASAARVIDQRPDAVFLSVGRDYLGGGVHADVKSRGLCNSIRLLGHRDDVAAILEATDVALMTSPQESFCLALAEAAAMGIPAVCVENGSAGEVIEHGVSGVIVPRADAADIASELVRLLADDGGRQRMGEFAERRVRERCAPEHVADLLLAAYAAQSA